MKSLKKSHVSWTTVAITARQLGRLGFAVVLARALGPNEFGVVAAVTIYTAFLGFLLETGFSAGLVQKRQITRDDEGAAFWVALVIALLIAAATALFSMRIATLLGISAAAPLLLALCPSSIIKALGVVPAGLLTRGERFKRLSLVEVAATLVGVGFGFTSLMLDAGAWAVVAQQLSTDLIFSALLMVAARRSPQIKTSKHSLRFVLSYSIPIIGSQFLNYAGQNADNVIVGKLLGQAALSFYTVPYRLMLVPVTLTAGVVSRVGMPSMSRAQGDRRLSATLIERSSLLAGALAIPVLAMLCVTALPLIRLVFGSEWLASAPVLQVLAISAIVQVVGSPASPALMSVGKGYLVLVWAAIPIPLQIGAFLIGARQGVLGVAWAFFFSNVFLFLALAAYLRRLVGIRVGAWFRSFVVPGVALCPGLLSVWTASTLGAASVLPDLAWIVLVAGLTVPMYVIALRFVDKDLFEVLARSILGTRYTNRNLIHTAQR